MAGADVDVESDTQLASCQPTELVKPYTVSPDGIGLSRFPRNAHGRLGVDGRNEVRPVVGLCRSSLPKGWHFRESSGARLPGVQTKSGECSDDHDFVMSPKGHLARCARSVGVARDRVTWSIELMLGEEVALTAGCLPFQ